MKNNNMNANITMNTMTAATINSLMKRGDAILADYNGECRAIAEDCVKEGYPSNGSNYGLRCEALWEDYYKEEYNRITDKIVFLKEKEEARKNRPYDAVRKAKAFISNNKYFDAVLSSHLTRERVAKILERWVFTVSSENMILAEGLWAVLQSGSFIDGKVNRGFFLPATSDAISILHDFPAFCGTLSINWEED